MANRYLWPRMQNPNTPEFEIQAEATLDQWSKSADSLADNMIETRNGEDTLNDFVYSVSTGTQTPEWTALTVNTTIESNNNYIVEAGLEITLPIDPAENDIINIACGGDWITSALVLLPNGKRIEGISTDSFTIEKNSGFSLIYYGGALGWGTINFNTDETTFISNNTVTINAPETITANATTLISTTGGTGPFTWTLTGGTGFNIDRNVGDSVYFYGNAGICGTATLSVTDLNGATDSVDIEADNGDAMAWNAGNAETIARSNSTAITIDNGVGPFTWSVSGTGFTLDSAETLTGSNIINADGTACGTATIICTDLCGTEITNYVRCTTGNWSTWSNSTSSDCKVTGEWDYYVYDYGSWWIVGKTSGKYEQKMSTLTIAAYNNTHSSYSLCVSDFNSKLPSFANTYNCLNRSGCHPNTGYSCGETCLTPSMRLGGIYTERYSPTIVYAECYLNGSSRWQYDLVKNCYATAQYREWGC